MINSQDVQFWQIRKRANRRKPWEVRWRVNAGKFSRSFATKALAESYRANLVAAARAGAVFAVDTGEPVAWAQSAETVYDLARSLIASRWVEAAGATRAALVRSLVPIVLASLNPKAAKRRRPEEKVLRRALALYALRPPAWEQDGEVGEAPDDIRAALKWLAATSRPVMDLNDRVTLRALLEAVSLRLDGKRLAHSSIRARRSTLHALLDFAAERQLLAANPLPGVKTHRRRRADAVDPRRIPSLPQARALLTGVEKATRTANDHLSAFFAVLYYAGTRPGEARALCETDCTLPEQGWGSLLLSGNRPEIAPWASDGDRWERRELKHRSPGEVRPVPIPPVLVAIVRAHLDSYGTAPDGRLFWEGDDFGPVTGQTYRRIWRKARASALSPTELASRLAERPYDLRHGNASLLLASGVPATEVARRLGHSVQMLWTTYAHWFDGMEAAANAAVDAALSANNALTSGNVNDGPDTGQHGKHEAS
ncbi:tyrosine-type recombinase/integrase [Actinomadura litoris]|uniref:tyrosine-type recombinase/integrase n=1 Tax=Actinomadura litoris TaxID=2678616 RepID=UPI001FA7611B|nr:tyrosine-type recombinase/integrase [Actinomadura litoris]